MNCKSLAALVAALLAVSGMASAEPIADGKIKSKLEERLPGLKIQSVRALSSWNGVYEVVTADEVLYADSTGDYLIVGKMMETATRSNLTEQRWNEINKIDFNNLPFDSAIKVVKGDGSRSLAIFEDPHCPYCHQLEATLKDMDNLTVYVFLYPLEDIHPGATKTATEIWCSPDRAEAWLTWIETKKATAVDACDQTPVDSLRALAQSLKINSTPTLIFPNGQRVPGAISAEKIEAQLNASRAP